MYAVLGPREGQSYNALLDRRLPMLDSPTNELSDTDFVVNEHTIALFHLYVASCLDTSVAERRKKEAIYNQHVKTLKALSGKSPGGRNWRTELAECLTKWHPVFHAVVKRRRSQPGEVDGVLVTDEQVDAAFL